MTTSFSGEAPLKPWRPWIIQTVTGEIHVIRCDRCGAATRFSIAECQPSECAQIERTFENNHLLCGRA